MEENGEKLVVQQPVASESVKTDFSSVPERGAQKTEFTDFVVSVRRVTKVTKGGKRFQFSAFVVSGNSTNKVGIGKGKGKDVTAAVAKATARARKKMFIIHKNKETIPYTVVGNHGASRVILKPAYYGTGMIAGGAVRSIFKAANINHVLAKSIGTSSSGVNLVKATLNGLSKCRSLTDIARLRGKTVKEILFGAHNHVG